MTPETFGAWDDPTLPGYSEWLARLRKAETEYKDHLNTHWYKENNPLHCRDCDYLLSTVKGLDDYYNKNYRPRR
jgi:hypothetical protein